MGTPSRALSRLTSVASVTSTGKPAPLRCSTQPLQQPQLGSLVTATFGRSCARRGLTSAVPATPARKARRVVFAICVIVLTSSEEHVLRQSCDCEEQYDGGKESKQAHAPHHTAHRPVAHHAVHHARLLYQAVASAAASPCTSRRGRPKPLISP